MTTSQTIEVFRTLQRAGVTLSKAGTMLVAKPSKLITPEVADVIRANKPGLLNMLLQIQGLPTFSHHKIPNWLRLNILKAIREKRYQAEIHSTAGWSVFNEVQNNGRYRRFIDHWGATAEGSFVCEPYATYNDSSLTEQVSHFCETFECTATIQPESQWNFGSTCRVTIQKVPT